MTNFKKIKIMPYNSLPATTAADEIHAVPFNLADKVEPNYGAKIELSTNTSYTVGSGALGSYIKGYLWAGCTNRSDETDASVTVNGRTALLMGCDTDYGGDLSGYCIYIPMKSGDSFYVNRHRGGGKQRVWFIPTR